MKKFFVIAALAASMSLVSCGGDKGNGNDSADVANQEAVEAVTGNPEADALIAKINACNSVEELDQIGEQNETALKALPQDVLMKVLEAAQAKANTLNGSATEVIEEVTEVTEVPGDALEAAQTAGEGVLDKAKTAGANAVEAAKAAGEDAVAKTKAAAEDVAAKTKAAAEDAAAKAKAAAKGLGL